MNTQIKDLSPNELKSYIRRGIIKVVNTQPIPTRIEDTPEFKKFKHLAGKPIHLSAACSKYDIALSTLSQWVHRGLIKRLGKEKNKVMLDEAYVAYAVEVKKTYPNSKGKWLFDTNGTPYIPATVK
jgi:predicted site-specific integrase-resolvase